MHAGCAVTRWPPAAATTIVFALLITLVAGVRLAVLGRPFAYNAEGVAVHWVLSSARNFVRYGPLASRGAGVLNSGSVPPEQWVTYAHHPPLTPLLSAATFAVGGATERMGRLPSAALSVATTALLFLFVRRRSGLRAATITGVVYAFCPMTLALGDMAEYTNAPLVFCAVATIALYVRWCETRRRSLLLASAGMFVLGALSDWPIFYLVPILAAHALTSRRASILQAAAFVAAASVLLAVLAAWVLWAGSDVSVVHQLKVRTSADDFTLAQWFDRVIVHHQGRLHTWPVVLLSLAGVAHIVRERIRAGSLDRFLFPALLMAAGLMNLLVAADGNFRHEWWSMLLTPAFAVNAALGAGAIVDGLPRRVRTGWAASLAGASIALLFVAWSANTARDYTRVSWQRDRGFSMENVGRAINRTAAAGEGVLTSITANHGPLWFYADRQLRLAITSVETLQQSLGEGPYRLFSPYEQPDGPAPTWFAMPLVHRTRFPALTAALDGAYPSHSDGETVIYRLR